MFLNPDSDDVRYAGSAVKMGMSGVALRMTVHRMRRKYCQLLREGITQMMSTTDEIDEEIPFLVSTLSA